MDLLAVPKLLVDGHLEEEASVLLMLNLISKIRLFKVIYRKLKQ